MMLHQQGLQYGLSAAPRALACVALPQLGCDLAKLVPCHNSAKLQVVAGLHPPARISDGYHRGMRPASMCGAGW